MATPANWYADPTGRFECRYWNGTEWTEHVASHGKAAVDPLQPAPAQSDQQVAQAATDLSTDEDVAKELAYLLATMCEEAERLYDKCRETADGSDRARALSQTAYVNGVRQAPASIRSFAGRADSREKELTGLLQELHDLGARGQSVRSDLLFLVGGSNSDFQTAMKWCLEHGIDRDVVSTIAVKGLFLRSDFGLTKTSFLEGSQRLNDALARQP